MYHGVASDLGSVPHSWSHKHTIAFHAFATQISFARSNGWHTLSPVNYPDGSSDTLSKAFCITFDDGHCSDMLAAQILMIAGFTATFFVTLNHLGRSGYLERRSIRDLSDQGFTIGSHGMSHVRMDRLNNRDLRNELYDSRRCLEDLIGKAVASFACPFGSYDHRVVAAARAADYRLMMTSDMGRAKLEGSYVLPRLPVIGNTSIDDFQAMLVENVVKTAGRRVRAAINRRRRNVAASVFSGWRLLHKTAKVSDDKLI